MCDISAPLDILWFLSLCALAVAASATLVFAADTLIDASSSASMAEDKQLALRNLPYLAKVTGVIIVVFAVLSILHYGEQSDQQDHDAGCPCCM